MPRLKTAERDLLPPGLKQDLYIETRGRCAHCGRSLAYDKATIDHIIPISKGGSNHRKNLTVLCEPCNKAKYDHIIDPEDYYAYMPAARLARVKAMFDEYIRSNDWLSWENLFRTDLFELDSKRAVMAKTSGKLFFPPVKIRVRKMLPPEAFQWLQMYRSRIKACDRCLIINDPRHIEHPFYEIRFSGTDEPVGVVECYMSLDGRMPDAGKLPCVNVNFFSHWDTKPRSPMSEYTLFYVLRSVVKEIQSTLTNSTAKSLVCLKVTSVASDPHINPMLSILPANTLHPFEEADFEGLDPDAATRGFTAVLFQGGKQEIMELMAETGANTEYELYKAADKNAMARPVVEKLNQSPENKKPDRIQYRDMPGGYAPKHKKPKKKKR